MMKLGVSECLLGVACRYDGLSASNDFVVKTLEEYFEFQSFCPEKVIFGTPREAIRQVDRNQSICIETSNSKRDVTAQLAEISNNMGKEASIANLCGFIVKSKSPTCGLERVRVYDGDKKTHEKKGIGLFAKALREYSPYLPIEEEGRLGDAGIRENFLMQIFAYEDFSNFMKRKPKITDLIAFHTSYKYLIYAKSPVAYKLLGHIVSNPKEKTFEELLENYRHEFLTAINEQGNIPKTYNVLLHIYGYFKKLISAEEKAHLLTSIEEFREKIIPLVAVTKLLNLYVQRFDMQYLKKQKFLNPYPSKLGLRSEVKAFR